MEAVKQHIHIRLASVNIDMVAVFSPSLAKNIAPFMLNN